MFFRRARVVLLVTGVSLTLAPRAHADAFSVEEHIVQLIDADRATPLVIHSGLRAAAREHSMEMARDGSLGHEGADERVNNAPPDPYEFNGAPDDGFGVAAWCEGVTYSVGRTEEQAPRQLYDQWYRSGAHRNCMMDTSRNVGAVGIYYDGESWWATFIAEKDATPPGPAVTPKPRPAAPADAHRTPKPEAAASPATGDDDTPSTEHDTSEGAVVSVEATPVAVARSAPDTIDDTSEPSDTTPETGSVPVVSAPPVRRSDVPAIAAGAAVPLVPKPGIGWREFAAVAVLLSFATVVVRRAIVRQPPGTIACEPVVIDEPELVLGR